MHHDAEHNSYPHNPGTLWDCAACEDGDCVCEPNGSGCVSRDCRYDVIPFELTGDAYGDWAESIYDPDNEPHDRLEEYGHA